MTSKNRPKRIAILGGGPSALFIYKRLIESKTAWEVDIFERRHALGSGMPYSEEGAGTEHITNVSDNEIPEIVTSIEDWIRSLPQSALSRFDINPETFNKFHVLPRLLFGQYLAAQFELLRKKARKAGLTTHVHFNSNVLDVIDYPEQNVVQIDVEEKGKLLFDAVVICTGHNWPVKNEGRVAGYYDSPYPPAKLKMKCNHPVAIKGSSLTAIDAIRTLARHNGHFEKTPEGKLAFIPAEDCPKFKMVMHSRNGLLPAIRFHLAKPQLSADSLLTKEEIEKNRKQNGGFLSLDFLFDKNFKNGFKRKDPKFYKRIKDLNMEGFVQLMMDMREGREPFHLFREEYREAEKSIDKRESIYWKEMLAELSFTISYPAKYFSAEDMMRLKEVLMPLISVVIAFVPQASCEELFALNDAGKLDLVSVGSDSEVVTKQTGGIIYKYRNEQGRKRAEHFETYIDCVGQPHLSYEDIPFKSLLIKKTVSQAFLRFKSVEAAEKEMEKGDGSVIQNANGDYLMKVSGITINDHFQVVNEYGIENERVYIMAVPYIGGYNPDYSGLDFCDEASSCILEKLTLIHQHA
ncbi:FAD/NAD(P)-binding protein [Dyadobacter sp. CY323]|uniref:FAD/NAD(P)-binding protein n=1 Tax=Dyadobacter sp. CY323 TaxID=2907302 RepID=UPI001F1F630B|nr:FAD/NAD(P)-binding protein [Dyadobacter sp. CY323]MCE6989606.1 FAD/NAD(P)-binding protein [Dyadobacter sp. CY323]